MRLCISLALQHKQHKKQVRYIDLNTALLNADIDFDIHETSIVNLPNKMRQHDIYMLMKTLYDLSQVPLMLHKKIFVALSRLIFRSAPGVETVFVLHTPDSFDL